MATNDLRSLLEHIRGVSHLCDLDLLLFFSRHSHALLTSEQIVSFVGHRREQVAISLDSLIDAGLLTRSQNRTHAARLYVLELGGTSGGWLRRLLKVAATREGRQELKRLLASAPDPSSAAGPRPSASIHKIA